MLSLGKGSTLPHSACKASAEAALTSQLHFESDLEKPRGEAIPEANLFQPKGESISEASLFQPEGKAIPA